MPMIVQIDINHFIFSDILTNSKFDENASLHTGVVMSMELNKTYDGKFVYPNL